MSVQTLSPSDVRRALDNGAMLIDIREADEFAREHIPGARNIPLSRIHEASALNGPVVFLCKGGMRTAANADKLQAAVTGATMLMDGGIEAWRKAGLATVTDSKQPLEIMRQVQIGAGSLILIGVLLGFLVHPGFFGVSAFVGAGLTFAGVTGWCGMALMLRHMPWNRAVAGK